MTSRRSLSNKRKGSAYSFFSALKTSLLPGGILAVIGILVFGVMPFSTFYDYKNDMDYSTGMSIVRDVKAQYKFITFMDGQEAVFAYFFLVLLAVVSVVAGIAVFRFTADKRTVNVYYSLGIKRTSLFYSKYFAGALVLCASVAVSVIASYIVNLIYVGASWQLSLVLLYFYCGLSLFALLVYTVTAAVFASVGTISESILYSVGVLALPTVVLFSVQRMLSLLENTVFGKTVYPFQLAGQTSWNNGNTADLVTTYSSFNPVLFFSGAIQKYAVGVKENGKVLIGMEREPWELPSIITVLPWFFVVAAVALLAGFVFFKHRKAENCGFLNTNKPLSAVVLIELMFLAACVPVTGAEYSPLVEVLPICAALAIAAYIGFEIFLERNVRLFFRKLWKLPVCAVLIAAVFTSFVTGFFGYDTYVPEAKEVKSVAVSLPLMRKEITAADNQSLSYMSDGFVNHFDMYGYYELPEMSGEKEIKTVVDAHRAALDVKDGHYPITLRYMMKGGRVVQRSVRTDAEGMNELFTLYEADECKKAVETMLTKDFGEKPTQTELRDSGLSMFRYENASVTAISRSMQEGYDLHLKKEQFDALKKALLADLLARDYQSYFRADKKQLGVLRFETDVSSWESGGYYEEGVTSAMPYADPGVPSEEEFPEDAQPIIEAGGILEKADMPYSDLGYYFVHGEYAMFNVIVDESMTNTLSYFKSIGAEKCFDTHKAIRSVSFRAARVFSDYSADNRGWNLIREFYSDSITPVNGNYWELQDNPETFVKDVSENPVTDNAKIAELDGLMRLHAFDFDSGYWCLVCYADGSYSSRFLPEDLAPQYVKDFNYTLGHYEYF